MPDKVANNTRIILAAIFLACILAYLPLFNNGFTNWDDPDQVLLNPDVHGLSFSAAKHIFSSFYVGMYQPVTMQVYAFIYAIFGEDPTAFHVFSLIIHLINVLLVFILVRYFSRQDHLALITAGLFALTPLQVESVAWVSALSNLLYTAFYLAGLCTYLFFLRKKKWLWLAITFLLFVSSVLSKPAAVTFPVMIYFMDLYYRRGYKVNTLLEKLPFLAVSIVIGMVIIGAREQAGHIIDISEHFNFAERVLLVVYALAFYIARLFVPTGLSAFHPYPDGGHLTLVYYIAPLIPLMILFLIWRLRAEPRRQTLVGMVFFLTAIAIVMEIIPVGMQVVKERYVYLPSVGLYYSFAVLLMFFCSGRKAASWLPGSIVMMLLLVFAFITFARTGVWHDSLSLWNDVLDKYPETSAAYINRGNTWLEMDELNHAVNDYSLALKYEPGAADAYLNRGLAYFRLKEQELALKDFNHAISLGIRDAETYNNRGLLRANLQDTQGAIADFDEAVLIDPAYTEAWINKGLVLANNKNYRQAFTAMSKAIGTDPSSARAYFWRGMVQYRMGLTVDACRDFRAAVSHGWPASQIPGGICE